MTDRPILFSGPMVDALMNSGKTETRRILHGKSGRMVPLASAKPGDLLYVREALQITGCTVRYAADGAEVSLLNAPKDWIVREGRMPGMFMPRWASRLTLTVMSARTEVLQSITEDDARAEGMPEPYLGDGDPPFEEQATMVSRRMQYRNLWKRLNGEASWDANPEVLVLSFIVQQHNIDRIAA